MPEKTSPANLWILKSKGENSAFGGNTGYADKVDAVYVYDTNVKNHDKVKVNDYVVIVNKKYILGFAKINSVMERKNVPKVRYRCPECNTQEHYKRVGITPTYKCRNKHEFDNPIEQNILVNEYTAHYNSSFIPAPPKTDVKILRAYFIRWNLYYSIQPAEVTFLNDNFRPIYNRLKNKTTAIAPKPAFEIPVLHPYEPDSADTRTYKLRKTPSRQGQQRFKEQLLGIYGDTCMLTGCNIKETIEASHICFYRGKKDHHPANGLLLRKDIHSLFDANLFGIHPETMKVHLHSSLRNSYYEKLEGKSIKLRNKKFNPSTKALIKRWKEFKSKSDL
ncbi:hypothetical protein A3860_29875 [Niastella vici]|uniref:HNH nuclease domain-containing protein n=1 Tax=Niastella vici TaxID=1703345 RepID=A0A1V9FUC5_9BACT|nr:HNH endonuclease [Niastella vici]OQP61907.1 hypothetical protein A3860_29875 [Niastella vici]